MLTKTDLSQIRNVVHEEIQQELKPVKNDIQKIQKNLDLVSKSLDRDLMTLRRKVEDHIANHPHPVLA